MMKIKEIVYSAYEHSRAATATSTYQISIQTKLNFSVALKDKINDV